MCSLMSFGFSSFYFFLYFCALFPIYLQAGMAVDNGDVGGCSFCLDQSIRTESHLGNYKCNFQRNHERRYCYQGKGCPEGCQIVLSAIYP